MLSGRTLQQQCLAGTPTESRIPRRFERYAAEYKQLRQCAGTVDDGLLRWAKHAIGSRSYEWHSGERDRRAVAVMVPFADMFNDDPAHNAQWSWQEGTDAFQVHLLRDVSAGEEILVSYGKKANEHLLTHYGFVHSGNRQDFSGVGSVRVRNIGGRLCLLKPNFRSFIEKRLARTATSVFLLSLLSSPLAPLDEDDTLSVSGSGEESATPAGSAEVGTPILRLDESTCMAIFTECKPPEAVPGEVPEAPPTLRTLIGASSLRRQCHRLW